MLRTFCAVGAVALLALPATAQFYVTSPGGYTSKSGEYFGTILGAQWRQARVQIGDPDMSRGGILALQSVSWRCDELTNYQSYNGMGRKFSKLSLSLGHTNCAKFGKVFSQNVIGNLTGVYSGAFSFPTLSGVCRPTWGSAGSLSFSKTFFYDGKNDLLQEWVTTGATFANGYTGSGASYYADGCYGTSSKVLSFYGGAPEVPGSKYLPTPPFAGTRCTDSSQTFSNADAYTYLSGQIYSDDYPITSLRGTIRVSDSRAYYMAKKKPWVGGVSIGGYDNGVTVLAHCNKQYVNLFFTLVVVGGVTDASGRTGDMLPNLPAPYINGYSGIQAFSQAAWTESKSGYMALTKAVKIVMPRKPDGKYRGCQPVCATYEYRVGNRTYGPYITKSVFYNVIERFRRR